MGRGFPERFLAQSLLTTTLLATTLLATPAFATHWTVRPDGSGDFPTMNAAVLFMSTSGLAETLLVEPGYYDEVVNNSYWFPWVIYAPGGPEATRVREFVSLPEATYFSSGYGKVVGLTIDKKVSWGRNSLWVRWENCVFAGGYDAIAQWGNGVPTTRCTFRGPSSFVGFGYEMTDCVFESAPAYFENIIGYLKILRCTFRGPGAELARVWPRDNSEIVFEECAFSNADNAIVVVPRRLYDQMLDVSRCRFENLSGAAVEHEYADWTVPELGRLSLHLADNRMFDVGQAVHAYTSCYVSLSSTNDTIATTGGIAIDAAVHVASVRGLRLSDAGGAGVRLVVQNAVLDPHRWRWSQVLIEDSRVRSSGGAGLIVEQMNGEPESQVLLIQRSTFEENGGPGAVINGPGWANRDNASLEITSNTAVGNAEQGIVVASAGTVNKLVLDRNLATSNGGVGIAVLAPYAGDASFNDAWGNAGAPYAGLHPQEINLELDPLYCMPSTGDFQLRTDSPCAPSGIYGQIGAFGVGCAVPTSVPLSVGSTAGLRVAPNPSRGQLSFAWGAGVRLDELTVFDVTGRKVWSASSSSLLHGALRWDARDANGLRVPVGVYFARWRAGSVSGSTRVVLLDD